MNKDYETPLIVDAVRDFMKLESAGGILLGSILSAVAAYALLHRSLPKMARED